ncbi:MAG: DNA translocase FtsK [Chloroflexi bacterium]|nr:DNA translocase FtsK [Chloroflexota bacterium]
MATKANRRRQPAAKKTTTRRKGHSGFEAVSRALLRVEVGGVFLVLLALFTLLSVLTSSRGQLTGGWVDLLQGLFGWGLWAVPAVLGALGLWMVVRAVEQMPNLAWQRPAGLALLFLCAITALSLLVEPGVRAQLAAKGDAGGAVGRLLADWLEQTVSRAGAWAAVTFLAMVALFWLFERLLVEIWSALLEWSEGRSARPAPAAALPAPPVVPMPTGQLPWWKRLWALRPVAEAPNAPLSPAGLVRPEASVRGTPQVRATAPARGETPPVAEGELPPPRIVGGGQEWKLPDLATILTDYDRVADDDNHIRTQGRLIQETLALFGVPADFEGAYKGPSVTQYLIKPGYLERKTGADAQRVKVKIAKIAALANDLALALAAPSVRIEAPIPGTNYVGVEVPNQASNIVGLKELMESEPFRDKKRALPIVLGEDVKGQPIAADMVRMPHLLIAGATGSGKSVCINSIVACLLLTNTPDQLRLLMIDPKMVELSVYNGIPHLLSPVVTEIDKAAGVLFWAVKEMERRYTLFSKANARDLPRYNSYLDKNGEKRMPYIVVVVDEMADLMMAAPEEVEKHICRLAQMARAVGIHLIIATQRPSVDVITGLIKANFPSRIAFAVTSQTDSRVILDVPGAERLLGRGDMLFMAPDASKLERLQGTLVTDDEIARLVQHWRGIRPFESGTAAHPAPELGGAVPPQKPSSGRPGQSEMAVQPPLFAQIEQLRVTEARDDLYETAVAAVREQGRGSVSLLQRKLRVGYTRAARLIDQMQAAGVLGPDLGGTRGREYLGLEGPAEQPSPAETDAEPIRQVGEGSPAEETFAAWADLPPWEEGGEPGSAEKGQGGETAGRPAPPTIWY